MYTRNSIPATPGLNPTTDTAPAQRSPAADRPPRSREDVAREFEQHLLTHFVDTMLKGVFEESIAGNSPMVSAGRDEQKQVWVSQLAEHLAERGGIGLADKLLTQWEQRFGPETQEEADASGSPLGELRTNVQTTSAQATGNQSEEVAGKTGPDTTP